MQALAVPVVITVLMILIALDIVRSEKSKEIIQSNPDIIRKLTLRLGTDYIIEDTDPYLGSGMQLVLKDEIRKMTKCKKLYVNKEDICNLKDTATLWFIGEKFVGYTLSDSLDDFLEKSSGSTVVITELKKLKYKI